MDELIKAAIRLGKEKMLLEVKERCGYPGARQEEAEARAEFERCEREFLRLLEEYVASRSASSATAAGK